MGYPVNGIRYAINWLPTTRLVYLGGLDHAERGGVFKSSSAAASWTDERKTDKGKYRRCIFPYAVTRVAFCPGTHVSSIVWSHGRGVDSVATKPSVFRMSRSQDATETEKISKELETVHYQSYPITSRERPLEKGPSADVQKSETWISQTTTGGSELRDPTASRTDRRPSGWIFALSHWSWELLSCLLSIATLVGGLHAFVVEAWS